MTIEQLAKDLLAIIDSEMYVNDFGGLQCNKDSTTDIQAAMGRLEEAMCVLKKQMVAQPVTQDIPQTPQQRSSNKQWVELSRGEIMSMELPVDASVVDLAWAIEARVREKNT